MQFCLIQHAPAAPGLVGIEITDAVGAALCRPNIDGQHGMPATPDAWRNRAAIDIAQEVELPGEGAWVAFQRPDLDAVGAAAVLVLRQLGLWEGAPDETRARVAIVAEHDSFRPGDRWSPSALPTEEQPWPTGEATVDATRELAALASICAPRQGDADLPLPERVAVTACWLLWGEPGIVRYGTAEAVAALWDGCGAGSSFTPEQILRRARNRVEGSRLELVRSVRSPRALELRCAGCGERMALDGRASCQVEASSACQSGRAGRVAIVRAAHAGVLPIGYCLAPVVVAIDQATPGKYTICSWSPEHLYHGDLRGRLNAAEEQAGGAPRWGGGAAITGSPQVPGGSRLPEGQVIEAAMTAVPEARTSATGTPDS